MRSSTLWVLQSVSGKSYMPVLYLVMFTPYPRTSVWTHISAQISCICCQYTVFVARICCQYTVIFSFLIFVIAIGLFLLQFLLFLMMILAESKRRKYVFFTIICAFIFSKVEIQECPIFYVDFMLFPHIIVR